MKPEELQIQINSFNNYIEMMTDNGNETSKQIIRYDKFKPVQ